MLKRGIDLSLPLRCMRYGRMSGEQQNPRSPDQQFDEIDLKVERQRRPWVIAATYRDDALSGRYLGKRPGFQAMLRDIRTKRIKVDAILVDTWERLGRADEMVALRQELWNKYGVVVLTANTDFQDPTTETGQMVGMFEQVRATAANSVKAHEVFRGKRDLALRKRWPGGAAPFGKRLRKCIETTNGREDVYSVLEDDPASVGVVVKLLRLAFDTGWGSTRLTEALNRDPEVPGQFKPFNASTVGYILDNPIYVGDLRWAANCQGVANDVRVVQRNADDEVVWVRDFCPPVFPRSEWDAIQAIRRKRSDQVKAARRATQNAGAAEGGEKQISSLGAGMTLKFLLSGLVYCAECNSRMVASSSVGASRTRKKLSYYRCPLAIGGGCANRPYVREDKLRTAVLARVRARLFPVPVGCQGADVGGAPPAWLADLADEIGVALREQVEQAVDPRPALRDQLAQLDRQLSGWMLSLAKSDLSGALRQAMEAQYEAAAEQASALRAQLSAADGAEVNNVQVLDVAAAIDRLRRLDQVLAGGNVTAGNLELSLHIDRIDAHADGRVWLRTSKLGIFEGAADLLARGSGDAPSVAGAYRVTSRRRAKLLLADPAYEASIGDAERSRVKDADRFADIDLRWFWSEPLEITRESCWSADHAVEVATLRSQDPKAWTKVKLASHFKVSIPTINKALKLAARQVERPSSPDSSVDAT